VDLLVKSVFASEKLLNMFLFQLHLHLSASIFIGDNFLLQVDRRLVLQIPSPTQSQGPSLRIPEDLLIIHVESGIVEIERCDRRVLSQHVQLFRITRIVNKNRQLSKNVGLDFEDVIRMDPEFERRIDIMTKPRLPKLLSTDDAMIKDLANKGVHHG